MPTFKADGKTATLFMFNQIITWFGFLQSILIDNSSHFWNQLMSELSAKLGFHHENCSPYYPRPMAK